MLNRFIKLSFSLLTSLFILQPVYGGTLIDNAEVAYDVPGSSADIYASPNLSLLNIRNSNLNGADLSNADISFTILDGGSLNGVNFTNSNLSFAAFLGASVIGSDFRFADLSGALLESADFSNADIRGADLTGTEIGSAFSSDPIFSNTLYDSQTIFDPDFDPTTNSGLVLVQIPEPTTASFAFLAMFSSLLIRRRN